MRLPRWLLVVALLLGGASLIVGALLDAIDSLDGWPFLTNVGSSVVGFAFGLPVAVLVIGRLAEREEQRRWAPLAGFHLRALEALEMQLEQGPIGLDMQSWESHVLEQLSQASEQLITSPIGPELASRLGSLQAQRRLDAENSEMIPEGVLPASTFLTRPDAADIEEFLGILRKLRPVFVEKATFLTVVVDDERGGVW